MDYNITFETGTRKKTDKLSSNQMTIERDKKDRGFASLRKGQRITGMVVSVDKQVTLDFGGLKVATNRGVLKNAVPGEIKTFEVMKATKNEIELRLLEGAGFNRQTFKAAMIQETDRKSFLAQKEQSAKQTEREKEYRDTKNKLEEINSRLTERDCKRLEEDGFPTESMTINGLYGALNRVKAEEINEEQKEIKRSKAFSDEDIAKRLKEENLPETSENLLKVKKALELSDTALKIDDKSMHYLISREADPTIENIYKAYYSGNTQKQELQQKLSSKAWSELETQIKEVIGAAGYEVNEENLEDAKWLIENNLPLTVESFIYKKELDEIKVGADKNVILNKIMEGIKKGISPNDVLLSTQKMISYEQLITGIRSIEEETITKAVREGSEITIKRLVTIQESLSAGSYTEEINSSKREIFEDSDTAQLNSEHSEIEATSTKDLRYEEIRAQRQMEEIRLKMTLEAAAQLEKRGFTIDTHQLEKVVEALRDLEDNYYKELLRDADVEASELSLQTLKETTQSLEKLKYIPSYVLGSTLSLRSTQTIPGLVSEGSRLQAELVNAGRAYETLRTVPNREYGDSIRKAFANMDSLLSEMKVDNNAQNQRAVRILGYNQMEITEESIRQIKAYDLEVTTMMQNMHPAVTVRMIKEGRNPLEMPIKELNQTIDKIKEEQGISSEEKYSTYLRKLEKENGLTGEERNAYIGIYRLLYNIEKSDGAALGAVINAGRAVTLGHMLTAVRTNKKGSVDAVINDEFGMLERISREKETITDQLGAFSDGSRQQNDGQPSEEETIAEQTEYLDRILKQMKEEISPDKLQEVQRIMTQTGLQDSQRATALAPLYSSNGGIWESVKDVPIEKLWEQLQNAEGGPNAEGEIYAGKVQEIRELCKNSEQAIRFLNDFKVPSTPLNMMMANHILSNGESPIKKLIQQEKEKLVENSEISLKETDELSDTLIDKVMMNDAYEQLETNAKAALEQAYSEEKIDNQKLAQLKSIGRQMTFLRTLAGKEFYQIPIETEGGITNINLTILRGTETSGKVSVTVLSEQLGNIKADFSLKDEMLKGFIRCDNRNGLVEMQKNASVIENAAEEVKLTIKQIDFGVQRKDNDNYSYQNSENDAQGASMRVDTERILYRLAKAIVQTVRLAERSGTDSN